MYGNNQGWQHQWNSNPSQHQYNSNVGYERNNWPYSKSSNDSPAGASLQHRAPSYYGHHDQFGGTENTWQNDPCVNNNDFTLQHENHFETAGKGFNQCGQPYQRPIAYNSMTHWQENQHFQIEHTQYGREEKKHFYDDGFNDQSFFDTSKINIENSNWQGKSNKPFPDQSQSKNNRSRKRKQHNRDDYRYQKRHRTKQNAKQKEKAQPNSWPLNKCYKNKAQHENMLRKANLSVLGKNLDKKLSKHNVCGSKRNAIKSHVHNVLLAIASVAKKLEESNVLKSKNSDDIQELESDQPSTSTALEIETQEDDITSGKNVLKIKPGDCQVLLGVINCGQDAVNLLYGDTFESCIVVVSKWKPTKSLLNEVYNILQQQFTLGSHLKVCSLDLDENEETISVRSPKFTDLTITIRLTSPQHSDNYKAARNSKISNVDEDLLSVTNCKKALSLIRRTRWFTKQRQDPATCEDMLVIRIFMCLRKRKLWKNLCLWLLVVLVPFARRTIEMQQTYSDDKYASTTIGPRQLFRRCLAIISAGIFYKNGHGIKDPVEENVDISTWLTEQEAEDVTLAAMHTLRQLDFGGLWSIVNPAPGNSSDDA